MNSIWAVTVATLVKDIRLEWRSKDALNSMLFFSLLVVVILASVGPAAEGRGTLRRAAGWIRLRR
jgi:heme exporter protein B